MAEYAKRSVRSGFNRAMLLYIMNNAEWTQQIEDFATWSVEYDLWVKWHVFRDRLINAHMIMQQVESPTRNYRTPLNNLPNEFTKDMLKKQRPNATDENINAQIRQWKKRGLITYTDEKGVYQKRLDNCA